MSVTVLNLTDHKTNELSCGKGFTTEIKPI